MVFVEKVIGLMGFGMIVMRWVIWRRLILKCLVLEGIDLRGWGGGGGDRMLGGKGEGGICCRECGNCWRGSRKRLFKEKELS